MMIKLRTLYLLLFFLPLYSADESRIVSEFNFIQNNFSDLLKKSGFDKNETKLLLTCCYYLAEYSYLAIIRNNENLMLESSHKLISCDEFIQQNTIGNSYLESQMALILRLEVLAPDIIKLEQIIKAYSKDLLMKFAGFFCILLYKLDYEELVNKYNSLYEFYVRTFNENPGSVDVQVSVKGEKLSQIRLC